MVSYPEWPWTQVFSKHQSLLVWSLNEDFVGSPEMCFHHCGCDEELLSCSLCSGLSAEDIWLFYCWSAHKPFPWLFWTGRFPLLMNMLFQVPCALCLKFSGLNLPVRTHICVHWSWAKGNYTLSLDICDYPGWSLVCASLFCAQSVTILFVEALSRDGLEEQLVAWFYGKWNLLG